MSPFTDKKMKKIYFLIVALFTYGELSAQQDIQSSNWYQSNTLLNPAAVATEDSDFGFYTNCRFQYFSIGGQPMRTNTFAADVKIPDQQGKNNHFGVGLNAYNHQTGDGRLMTTNISIPVSYTMQVDKYNKLSVGISPGFFMQGFSTADQTWESQWTGLGFNTDPSTSGENLNNSYTALDIAAGLYYQLEIDGSYFTGGFSAKHLTRPKIDFSFGGDRLYSLYTFHLGGDIETIRDNLRVSPNVILYQSGPNTSLVFGASVDNLLDEGAKYTNLRKSKSLSYGVYYRWNDAIVATFGMNIAGYRFGLSFDATVSNLSDVNNSIGALEVYFKSQFFSKTKKRSKIKNLK